jgi:competence ComEA-like helix-hairpin-helix protein
MWNRSQRAVILAFIVGMIVYLTIRLSIHRSTIPDPQPTEGSRAADLATRLDANTATQAELAAIPTIGDKLAAAIVEYRERYVAAHPGRVAFGKPEDLKQVRGVGQARMETLSEHLTFPAPSAERDHAGRGN